MSSPGHDKVVAEFAADLADSVAHQGEAGDPLLAYGGVVED